MYDLAIIGGGAAGVSAAITAKVKNLNFIWFASKSVSDKVAKAELVKNYPALPSVTGAELGWTFKNHCDSLNITLREEVVTGVYDTGDKFTLLVGDKDFEARAVILCTGVSAAKPLSGEEEFLGRGVSYCATCDGNLYKGKTIAVIATDKMFEHEINYLCSLAGKVYVVPLYKNASAFPENAEVTVKTPVKISGNMRAEELEFKDGKLKVDGVFILRASVAPSTLVHGLKTEGGHISVNRKLETNIAGIYAAGDCTGRPYQYVKAAGEGNAAVHFAEEYISRFL